MTTLWLLLEIVSFLSTGKTGEILCRGSFLCVSILLHHIFQKFRELLQYKCLVVKSFLNVTIYHHFCVCLVVLVMQNISKIKSAESVKFKSTEFEFTKMETQYSSYNKLYLSSCPLSSIKLNLGRANAKSTEIPWSLETLITNDFICFNKNHVQKAAGWKL